VARLEALALLFALVSGGVSRQSLICIRLDAGACRRDGFAGSPVRFVVVFGVRVVYYSHSLFSVLSSKTGIKKAAGDRTPRGFRIYAAIFACTTDLFM
jgi:hypothetical protein